MLNVIVNVTNIFNFNFQFKNNYKIKYNFKVLTSGLVDVTISDPNREEIYNLKSTAFAWYDNNEIKLDGDYKICVKNDEFLEKRVYINIISFSKDKVAEKSNELKQLNDTHTSLEVILQN